MRLLPNVKAFDTKPEGKEPWEIIQNAQGQQLQWNHRVSLWALYTPSDEVKDLLPWEQEAQAGARHKMGKNQEIPIWHAFNDGPGAMDLPPPPQGMRFNTNKTRFDLIPASWPRVLAQILTKGATKYAPRNWEKGLSWSETLGSLHRHLDKWVSGETHDEETKCHHMGHVAWNALALMTMQLRGIGKDDIPESEDGTMKE